MRMIVKSIALTALALTVPASAMQKKNANGTLNIHSGQLLIYELPNYNGDSYLVNKSRHSISLEWNAASIAVYPGDSWQVCQKPRFQGTCITFTDSAPDLGRVPLASARPSSEVK